MKRLNIFYHHIYELKKGLRNLILFTTLRTNYHTVIHKLEASKIDYLVYPVAKGSQKINVFFGNNQCIEVLKKINKKKLADFSAEEDFLLGIMLGYDRVKQCERYLRHKERRRKSKAALKALQTKALAP